MDTHVTNSFQETQRLGEEFAKKVQPGETICLYGNLGAGKTTFMQGLAKGLGIVRRIISPTFIIVRKYDTGVKSESSVILGKSETMTPESIQNEDSGQVLRPFSKVQDRQAQDTNSEQSRTARMIHLYHIDLYRAETEADLESIGLEEILADKNAIIAIEWPERLKGYMPATRWEIHFEITGDDERKITIEKF